MYYSMQPNNSYLRLIEQGSIRQFFVASFIEILSSLSPPATISSQVTNNTTFHLSSSIIYVIYHLSYIWRGLTLPGKSWYNAFSTSSLAAIILACLQRFATIIIFPAAQLVRGDIQHSRIHDDDVVGRNETPLLRTVVCD